MTINLMLDQLKTMDKLETDLIMRNLTNFSRNMTSPIPVSAPGCTTRTGAGVYDGNLYVEYHDKKFFR